VSDGRNGGEFSRIFGDFLLEFATKAADPGEPIEDSGEMDSQPPIRDHCNQEL
jgi:hypothetical protein